MNDTFFLAPLKNGSDPWSGKRRPIFFYTGNEAPIEDFYSISGNVLVLAQRFNALVVFAEHRFYGKSMPNGSASFHRDIIGALNVENALAGG